jgi:hypothetical protein
MGQVHWTAIIKVNDIVSLPGLEKIAYFETLLDIMSP